jgi:hypothetical protein
MYCLMPSLVDQQRDSIFLPKRHVLCCRHVNGSNHFFPTWSKRHHNDELHRRLRPSHVRPQVLLQAEQQRFCHPPIDCMRLWIAGDRQALRPLGVMSSEEVTGVFQGLMRDDITKLQWTGDFSVEGRRKCLWTTE